MHRESCTNMAEKSYVDTVTEAFRLLMSTRGFDTEFAFLDSLLCEVTPGRDSSFEDGGGSSDSVADKHREDIKVGDIKIKVFSADSPEKDRMTVRSVDNEKIDLKMDPVCHDHLQRNGKPLQQSNPQQIKNNSSDCHLHCVHSHMNNLLSSYNADDVSQHAEKLTSLLQNTSLDSLCDDDVLVENFIHYLFMRRYGSADEILDNGRVSHSDTLNNQQAIADLNRRLDGVLKRMLDQPLTAVLMAAYSSALNKASGMPTLRKKLQEFVMLCQSRQRGSMDKTTFQHMKVLVLTGVSDVWSAVRKVCSAGVAKIFRDWSQEQQKEIFISFLEICIDKECRWQSKDGAALCVHAVMHNCFTRSRDVSAELPSYMVECVLTIVFSLISHPQLSIRETVARIMSSYIEHVDSQDMMDLMYQTLTLLTPPTTQGAALESFHCVEAYAAEGLLNICTSILKVLPVQKVVHLWVKHCSTFLGYLSHNASSVRQTSSTLVMHVATHRESIAALMKLVMQHLVGDWHVEQQALVTCQHFVQDREGGLTWEEKEGRMFVYELLCKHLIEFHTVSEDGDSSAIWPQRVCSHDGGSEADTALEDVYKSVSSHLVGKSSLTQLYLLDNVQHLANELGIQVLSKKEFQDLHKWLLLSYPHLAHEDSSGEASVSDGDLVLPSCQDMLMAMLHHTADCLADTQWELRRIAQQVLPCLCEVMCLYHVDLIMAVWSYVTEDTSLQSFLGLYALHQSLALCARVVATADLSSKESTISNPIYVAFVDGVRKHIEDYLPLVCHHLRRKTYDKMAVTAVETALLALNFFDLHEQIQEDLSSAVVQLWKNLYVFARPKSAIATSLFPAPQHEFHSPYEGFLSCCLVRPENNTQCAKQVEKSLMLAIYKHLPHFLPQLDSTNAAICLPLLAHNIGLFIDDTDVCKSLTNSFSSLCQCTRKSFASMASEISTCSMPGELSLKCVYFTVRELAAVIALKSLDVALLHKILNCYLTVCESLQPDTHIPLLLQGVSARLSGTGFLVDISQGGDLDVALCWRRPELPPGFGQHYTGHDEDSLEQASYTEETESDTSLNRSSSSLGQQMYSRTGRRRTLSTTDDILEIKEVTTRLSPRENGESCREEEVEEEKEEEEEDSDWDSWSEEEPHQQLSALHTHFQDFFQHLMNIYGAAGRKILQTEISKLGAKEQEVVKDVVGML